MNTKAFFPCGGGSNLILGIGTENQIFLSTNCQKMTIWHHWGGVSWGCPMPPVMGGSDGHPRDCKTTLNINIYPSTLVFFENIGHKYDFEGWGGVVPGRVWGWGWCGPDPKRKSFHRILIHIYLQSMFRLSFQSNAFKSIPYDKAYSSNLTN